GNCSLQGSGDVRYADEEGDKRFTALQWADAAGHRALDSGIDVAIARYAAAGVRPPEQLAVELPRRVRIRRPDLELNYRVGDVPGPIISAWRLTTCSTAMRGPISRCATPIFLRTMAGSRVIP